MHIMNTNLEKVAIQLLSSIEEIIKILGKGRELVRSHGALQMALNESFKSNRLIHWQEFLSL